MTTERRHYYRISDRALIKYRVISDDAVNDERRFIFVNEIRGANIHAALMGIDLQLQELLQSIRLENKPLAEAIELLNRKLTLLERVTALESSQNDSIDHREHQPTEVNLSGGGMGLYSDTPLTINAHLAIDLVLLPTHHPMRIIGRVVDCHKADQLAKFSIAIEFVEIREQDRDILVQHIVKKQSAALRVQRQQDGSQAA